MKYLVLIGDGMSDYPLKALKGKTPLEAAKTPNMDYLAKNGTCGLVNNVPVGLEPGSDVAGMSIFGYNPKQYYSGRGPLEAASLGVKLKKSDVAFRCNLVSIKKGRMKDFTAGHIETSEAKAIIKKLDQSLGTKKIKFYPGLSYRHLLVIDENVQCVGCQKSAPLDKIKTIPPHDITGQEIHDYLPGQGLCEVLLRLMNESEVLLHSLKTKATMIWPWGQGKSPNMPSFKKKFGKKGAVITAVHLLKGLGKTLGLDVINVPGATGYLDTNYVGKAQYALKALKDHDVVFVHVEAPDEAGHEGSVKKKIRAIEDFDKLVVGTILREIRNSKLDIRVLVLPDHPTPISLMTHTMDAVPFVVWGRGAEKAEEGRRREKKAQEGIEGYNEKEINKTKLRLKNGYQLLEKLFGGKL